jgi:anti-sigma B factor antagonist
MDQLTIENTVGPESVRVLKLSGPFTLKDIWHFQAAARDATLPITIVDLTDVPYMDSAALGSVMGVHMSRQRVHQKYAIVGANERLETLFEVAGVGHLLIRYPTTAEALKALGD